MFCEDFNLEVHFQVLKGYGFDFPELENEFPENWRIFAYFILPAEYSVITMLSGPSWTSFQCAMIINQNVTNRPSIEEQGYFKKAMRTLQLEPSEQKAQIASSYPTSD